MVRPLVEFRYRCAAEPTARRNIRQDRLYMRNLLQQRDNDFFRSALLHDCAGGPPYRDPGAGHG
jgi:hypothetical protein